MAIAYFLAVLAGLTLIVVVLWDTLETIVLPRTVNRPYRLTKLYYNFVGGLLRAAVGWLPPMRREWLLAVFGPLSLPLLFVFWAILLILGFGVLHWGLGLPTSETPGRGDLGSYLYYSGVTFLTLGYGDISPRSGLGRFVAVCEAGVGFGFLAVVISYLPVLYQSFSRREVTMTLLDARAGSPPTATELLRRHAQADQMTGLVDLLRDMERWASELLESYLSYPILAFYRSQHSEESWLTALTAVLDTCAIAQVGFRDRNPWSCALVWQAHLTFAMARHTIVDLALILGVPPLEDAPNRLTEAQWERLCTELEQAGIPLCDRARAWQDLTAMRVQYEPYLHALARRLYLEMPPWVLEDGHDDNWQASAYEHDQPHF